jgi:hypothetical protein
MRPANAPIRMAEAMPPDQASTGMTIAQCFVLALNRNLHVRGAGDAFTMKTEKALEALQRRRGVHVDGRAGQHPAFPPHPWPPLRVPRQGGISASRR